MQVLFLVRKFRKHTMNVLKGDIGNKFFWETASDLHRPVHPAAYFNWAIDREGKKYGTDKRKYSVTLKMY